MKSIFTFLSILRTSLSPLIQRLTSRGLGSFSWRPPSWISDLGRWLVEAHRRHPRFLARAFTLLMLLGLASYLALAWYRSRPKPHTVSFNVTAPGVTRLQETLCPDPVRIDFDESAARLDQVDKVVTTGIRVWPAVAGEWTWSGDRRLVFTPKNDWPADKEYEITFEKSLFPSHVLLSDYRCQFHTPSFAASIDGFEFYVDPRDPTVKQAVATLTFTHGVEEAELEKRTRIVVQGDEKILPPLKSGEKPFSVAYGPHKRTAYIRSAPLRLPRKEAFLKLMVEKGVRTLMGGAVTPEDLDRTLLIPDAYSLLGVRNAVFTLVRNENAEPEQILLLTTSAPVSSKEVAKKLALHALPKDRPADKDNPVQTDYEWSGPSEINETILGMSGAVPLTLVPGEMDIATLHSFKFRAPDNLFLFLKLKQGLETPGGFLLKEDFDTVAHAPVFPKEIRILSDGALLSLNTERKLTILSRGVPAIEYRIGSVRASQIHHLVSQSEGRFQSPVFENYHFNEDNLAEIFTEHQTVQATDKTKAVYSALDLTKYVSAKNETGSGRGAPHYGLFFLHVRGWDPAAKKDPDGGDESPDSEGRPVGGEDRRLILVTDLGFLVKHNEDGSSDVFVQSIQTGKPVEGARVEVLGKNGVAVLGAHTGADGRASFPKAADFKREREPVAWLVRKGDDVSFMRFEGRDRELNFSRFDTGGIEPPAPESLDGFVFSERGLYRPGDLLHFGLIVKRHDWKAVPAGLPVETEITDPRGLVVQTRQFSLPSTGLFETTHVTSEASPTGMYALNLYLVTKGKRDVLLGSTMVRVQEFLPDRLKLKAWLTEERSEGWVSPEGLKARVNLQNLFGAAAADHRITARMALSPRGFHFTKYPEHTFFDPLEHSHAQSEDLAEAKTDDKGDATFDLALGRFGKATWALSFSAQGFELEGGRCVGAGSSTLVSPLPWLIGYKPDGDLRFVHKDGKRAVDLVAVSPLVAPVSVEGLELRVIQEKHVSVLTQLPNGNYAYHSVAKEEEVRREALPLSDKGARVWLPTGTPGNFEARLYDKAQTCVSRIPFSVAGHGNISRSIDRNAELKVNIPGREFRPGESIPIHITAPYTGAGLITIERGNVHAQQWFRTESTSSVQTIKIPEDFEGNGYLNIAFIRALDSKEIYMSPLSYAVVPFSVSREKRTVHVDLAVPDKTRPGEPLTISYKSDRPSKIIVYAVDEGILQVARYDLPKPLDHFFQRVRLGVRTSQIMDLLLPEFSVAKKVAAAGGDGSEELIAKNLNPFKRKTDPPVVFWSGILDAGTEVRKVVYPVPDYFNGTLRVMAVAVAPDAMGSLERKLHVKGAFVINPNVPTFVAPGDEFDVSVSVANTTDGSGMDVPVTLDLSSTEGIEIVQRPPQPMKISEGREISARFQVKVRDVPGNADLVFTATGAGGRSTLASHLSVRPVMPFSTSVESGYFDNGHKEAALTRSVYPQFRKAEACISPLPLGFSRGLNTYLQGFPYGCTEQLVSKAFPSLVLADQLEFGLTKAQADEHLQYAIHVLRTRQNDQGAFGYWSARESGGLDLPSVYAMHYLTEARRLGHSVPDDMMKRGLAHLERMSGRDVNSLHEARIQAYAMYILTLNEVVTTNHLVHLREWLDTQHPKEWLKDITCVHLAAVYAMLKQDDEAAAVIRNFRMGGTTEGEESDFHTDLGVNAQYIAVLARHFPQRLKKLTPDDLQRLVKPLADGRFNTLSAAYAILALRAYGKSVDLGQYRDLAILEVMPDGVVNNLPLPTGAVPCVAYSDRANAIRFTGKNAGDGLKGLFFQTMQAGFDRGVPKAITTDGIEVQHEYRDRDNKVTDHVGLGGELTVHVKVRTINRESVSHVAVVDLLPGGFEVVPESITPGREGYWIEQVDVREDRVVFFGNVHPDLKEFIYRIRATNKGTYTTPPAFAESMYNRKIRANGLAGALAVQEAK